jgi:soluble lytic murein transglycosylase
VIENSVVYDSLRGARPQQTVHVSRYLGKDRPA